VRGHGTGQQSARGMKAPVFLRGLALAALLAWAGCKSSNGPTTTYETAPAKKGDITQIVTASGTLSALVSVDVGSQISGRILSLTADFNSQVKKGAVVAQIDPAIYQAVVDQSQGELESSKAALELTRLTAARKAELVERKAGTQADLDKANADLAQAKATVMIKQAQLEKAKADLANCQIEAPVDGIVISRKVDVGQTVAAAMTTPVLYTIAKDITKMHIVATVSEADIGQVADGQTVDFGVDAFPDDVFHGKVSQVRKASTTTNNVVTYDTVIDVENPDQKLFPGMTADVSIYVADRHNILTVPNAALRFIPPESAKYENAKAPAGKPARGTRTVYLTTGNGSVLKVVTVKIGITDGITSEVLNGLNENDRVVTAAVEKKGGGPFGGPSK
jgi:HlyD family secretion protein